MLEKMVTEGMEASSWLSKCQKVEDRASLARPWLSKVIKRDSEEWKTKT